MARVRPKRRRFNVGLKCYRPNGKKCTLGNQHLNGLLRKGSSQHDGIVRKAGRGVRATRFPTILTIGVALSCPERSSILGRTGGREAYSGGLLRRIALLLMPDSRIVKTRAVRVGSLGRNGQRFRVFGDNEFRRLGGLATPHKFYLNRIGR